MGLDIRKIIGRRASNGVLSVSELQKIFSRVIGSTAQTSQSISSNLTVTGDIAQTGDLSVTGTTTLTGDLDFPALTTATTALMSIKSSTVELEIEAGATDIIEVDVPIGALLLGAAVIANTDLTFTTGTEVTATLTAETSEIGTLASKNDKGAIMVVPSLVAGAVETITLTADAGTVDSGTVTGTIWYIEPTDFTDVA